MPEKILYTAEALSTGDGRNGHVTSSDNRLDFDLRFPKEMGGEQLFRVRTLAVTLLIHLPNVSADTARALTEAAHQVCPYSRATHGNITVDLQVV